MAALRRRPAGGSGETVTTSPGASKCCPCGVGERASTALRMNDVANNPPQRRRPRSPKRALSTSGAPAKGRWLTVSRRQPEITQPVCNLPHEVGGEWQGGQHLVHGQIGTVLPQRSERTMRRRPFTETRISHAECPIDPDRARLFPQCFSHPERGLLVSTGIEMSTAESDEAIGVRGAGWVEAHGVTKVRNASLRFSGKRFQPA